MSFWINSVYIYVYIVYIYIYIYVYICIIYISIYIQCDSCTNFVVTKTSLNVSLQKEFTKSDGLPHVFPKM